MPILVGSNTILGTATMTPSLAKRVIRAFTVLARSTVEDEGRDRGTPCLRIWGHAVRFTRVSVAGVEPGVDKPTVLWYSNMVLLE
jgi:hypothetical protein